MSWLLVGEKAPPGRYPANPGGGATTASMPAAASVMWRGHSPLLVQPSAASQATLSPDAPRTAEAVPIVRTKVPGPPAADGRQTRSLPRGLCSFRTRMPEGSSARGRRSGGIVTLADPAAPVPGTATNLTMGGTTDVLLMPTRPGARAG